MKGISLKVTQTAGEMITNLLEAYQDKLNKAYLKSDGALTVDLKGKFKPGENDSIEVEVSINFVTDRIKNTFSRLVNENQEGLFEIVDKEQEVNNLRKF